MRRPATLLLLIAPGLAAAQGWTPPPARTRPPVSRPAPQGPAEEAPGQPGPLAPQPAPRDPSRPTKVTFQYLHHLSTWTGEVRISWPRLAFDRRNHELLMVDSGKLRFFIPSGMEVFRINEGWELGQIMAAAALPDDTLALLVKQEGRIFPLITNFRGDPLGEVPVRGLPWSGEDAFVPSTLLSSEGLLYLVDQSRLRLAVLTPQGELKRAVDLREIVGEDTKGGDLEIRGVSVDAGGTVMFAIPSRFRVHLLDPASKLAVFGQKGDKLGRFNVVVAVAADDDGVLYTSDVLKGTVQVFDRDFNYVDAVKGQASREARLGAVGEIVVGDGRLYVSQGGQRGVAVFAISKE